MNNSELRIGNFVNFSNVLVIFDEDDWDCIVNRIYSRTPMEKYSPIPLTEEWLLRFGFELEIDFLSPIGLWGKEECGNQRRAVGVYNPDNEEDWYMMFREDVGINWVDLNEIKYVHQLQNLYFALTNEELSHEQ